MWAPFARPRDPRASPRAPTCLTASGVSSASGSGSSARSRSHSDVIVPPVASRVPARGRVRARAERKSLCVEEKGRGCDDVLL